ncbi:MAG: PepSY domain-containing protein [Roseburia sp.]
MNMKKIKNLFATPKKAIVTSVCLVGGLGIIGTGSVVTVGAVAESNSIGKIAAENIALADAGVEFAQARIQRTEFDFENGHYLYEVEFAANGAEYDYRIKASDGTILGRESNLKDAMSAGAQSGQTSTANTAGKAAASGKPAANGGVISLDAAKEKALADAGVKAADVTFTRGYLDTDDGISVYDVEFYTAATKYEYEIKAESGDVYSKSVERPINNTAQSGTGGAAAGNAAISLDTAKEKALADAGVKAADVTYTKGQLDWDDGISIYDIEFYTADREYEYEINATSGAVHKKSSEAFQVDGAAGATVKAPAANNTKPATTNTAPEANNTTPAPAATNANTGAYISVDNAKSIAVTHAGLSLSGVTFSKTKLDNDDGRTEYEIEFYQGTMEYDYTIDATSGAVLEYDVDSIYD